MSGGLITTFSSLMIGSGSSYKSPASFGKAMHRAENVENALPKSPCKRVAVVRKLANDALQVKLPALSSSISTARDAELETAVLPE